VELISSVESLWLSVGKLKYPRTFLTHDAADCNKLQCHGCLFGTTFCWLLNIAIAPSSIIWYRLHHWDVNRHITQYTGHVSVVSQCKSWCLAEGLRKWRSAPLYGPKGSRRTLRFYCNSKQLNKFIWLKLAHY